MPQTRIGVVGAGVIARRHVRTLARFDDVRVVAIADPDTERARTLAGTVGAAVFADVDAMLDEARPDAVYVCVPPFAHGAPELAAAARGLPFFVEKPLATDLATAEEIDAVVREKGLVTGVGYHWRWIDTVEHLRGLLAARPARLAVGSWLDATPPVPWWQRRDLSGGQLVEQVTHLVDTARLLVGEIEEVHGFGARSERAGFPDSDVDDVTTVAVRFATGAVGTFVASCLLAGPHAVGLQLVADGVVAELTEKTLTVVDADGREERTAAGDPFAREDRAFVDAVQGGPDRTRADYAEALRTHRVTVTAARSVAEGVPLRVPAGDGR
ncbi:MULTISPECIES: Gfo/Idh/MocA family protein [unclassified Geodermatophilus]|uniref:Gfo/Idh/MocA family protein n=1 Tax=unclassified Geodermatophilus TaxID=2637632 RepID=UPI003EEBFE3C